MAEVGTVQNGVLIGRDGFLFLAQGGHGMSSFVTGQREVDAAPFETFRRNILARRDWAARQEAQYLHVIMPDKQSIVPEYWPLPPPLVRLGALYMERHAALRESLLYPCDLLAVAKERAVPRVETHLTQYGSLLVARQIVERLTGAPQADIADRLAGRLTHEVTTAGDLGAKLTPPVLETFLKIEKLEGKRYRSAVAGGDNGSVDLQFNPAAKYRKCLVLMGDSFGRDVAFLLSAWYAEVHFFRTGHFHEEIAGLIQPDILITENMERYLDNCVADELRPHFLLYPYLQQKPCEASAEFAAALSAVLSYPRRPHADFMTRQGMMPRTRHATPAAQNSVVSRYDGATMADPDERAGLLEILEAPASMPRPMPEFMADLSLQGIDFAPADRLEIHGSYLVRRTEVLLFGPNHLVGLDGTWSCEARRFKPQFLTYSYGAVYQHLWPGKKPELERHGADMRLSTVAMTDDDITIIDEPIFLATPLEPSVWGRWIATVAPKVAQFQKFGDGRKFFCDVARDWQGRFLSVLGLAGDRVLPHDPGRTYWCRDVMTVEYSLTNMSISRQERLGFFELAVRHRGKVPARPKLFISRQSLAGARPNYRVLLNEAELAAALQARGFETFEPETVPFEEQIARFAAAEQIVFLGGSGLYNAVFCAPGTSVVDIESSTMHVRAHMDLLASLGLRYGVIFGAQDPEDTQPVHRRWTLDVARACAEIDRFFADA